MSVNQVEDNEKAQPMANVMHEGDMVEADTTKVDEVASVEKTEVDPSLKMRL